MIQTLLDAIHRQQIEQYEDEKVYELDCRNPKAEDSDVLLVTLAAEFLGLQKTIELALACHAKSGISDPVGSKERTDNSQRRPLAKSLSDDPAGTGRYGISGQ